MERPRGEAEAFRIAAAHADVAHRVEEKLEIPDAASERGEEVVPQHGNAQVVLVDLWWRTTAAVVAAGDNQFGMLGARLGGEVLVAGLVFDVEENAPDEVRGEAAEHDNDQARQARPEFIGAEGHRGFTDRLSRSQAEAEAGAHDTGEGRDDDAFLEIELLDGFQFFLGGHFLFLVRAGQGGDPDADEADSNTQERDLARCGCGDLADRFPDGNFRHEGLQERRQERAEGRAVTERHAHAKGHAEVAHGQAEGEPAEAPQHAEEIGPPQCGEGLAGERASDICRQDRSQQPRTDDPGKDAADEPVGLPGPFFDRAVGNIKRA